MDIGTVWRLQPDHPRTRGVYTPGGRTPPESYGSSPHARGLPRGARGRRGRPRIIPARAGFTSFPRRSPVRHPDHPRTRGVYPLNGPRRRVYPGSSPHARGLLIEGVYLLLRQRIIPARAGFTRLLPVRSAGTPDHPRTRGVYSTAASVAIMHAGSSPHARGLPGRRHRDEPEDGIIPARAGFTSVSPCPSGARWDHPRTRGVYLLRSCPGGSSAGSSPHARGLPRQCKPKIQLARIIPARAGFTFLCPCLRFRRPDHPRTRGVYAILNAIRNGASRIIPARAGFT